VDFYYQKKQETESHWLGFTENIVSNNLNLLWQDYPNSGIYKIYALFTTKDNEIIKGPEMTISIE
jgi:hypothetical protein